MPLGRTESLTGAALARLPDLHEGRLHCFLASLLAVVPFMAMSMIHPPPASNASKVCREQ